MRSEILGKQKEEMPNSISSLDNSDLDKRAKAIEQNSRRIKMEVALLESQDKESEYEEETYRYQTTGETFQEILDIGYSGDAKRLFHTAEQYRIQKYGHDSLPLGDFYCSVYKNISDPDPRGRKEQFLGKQMLIDIMHKCITIYEKHNIGDMKIESGDDYDRKEDLMALYKQISAYYEEQNDYSTALQWIEKLLGLEPYFDDENIWGIYEESAEIYALQNKFESAIYYYEKALKTQQEHQDWGVLKGGEVHINHSIASIYRKQGFFEKAIDLYEKVLEHLISEEGGEGIIDTLKTRIELANTYIEMHDFKKAHSLLSNGEIEMMDYIDSIPQNEMYDLGEAQYFLKDIYTHMLALYTVEGVNYSDEHLIKVQKKILYIQGQDAYKSYEKKKETMDEIDGTKSKTDKERIYENKISRKFIEENARAIFVLEQDVGLLKRNIEALNARKEFFEGNRDVLDSLIAYETQLKELQDTVEKIQKDEALRKGYYEALSIFKKEYIMAMVVGMNKLKQKTPTFDIAQKVGEFAEVVPGAGDFVSVGVKNTARILDKGIQEQQKQEAEKLFDTLITISREQEFFIRLSSEVVLNNMEGIKKGENIKQRVAKETKIILGILKDSDIRKKIEGKSHKEIVNIIYDTYESSQKSFLEKGKDLWRDIFQFMEK